jgi:MerR family transcriptional regulator, light-induced transcriptional regulator
VERRLRIGELAQQTHVTPDLLRAWERRYGLLAPQRSNGGYRLYSPADADRVEAMVRLVESGVPAGEAARLVLADAPAPDASPPAAAGDLRGALDRFDEAGAQAALDGLLAALSFDAVAGDVLLPYLRDLGERWERGEASVGQEHFATTIVRGRLLALARGWDRGIGPRALLACAPGERHDLGLLVFGLALRERGWRVTHLGPDTPLDTLAATAADLEPAATVIVALTPARLRSARDGLADLAGRTRLLLAGAGASPALAAGVGAELLDADPLQAADRLTLSAGAR